MDNGNKRVNNASISMKNMNIVINGQSNHAPRDRGNEREKRTQERVTANPSSAPIQVTTDLNSNGNSESIQGKIKKQERTLNKEYSNMVTQEQRFEAKKYVLDQLVSVESTISEWPKPQITYFRRLCSLYDFGPGYRAVNREVDKDPPKKNLDMGSDRDNSEEVESETDATAKMMNIDGPPVVTSIANMMNPMFFDGPNQPGVSINQVGVNTQDPIMIMKRKNRTGIDLGGMGDQNHTLGVRLESPQYENPFKFSVLRKLVLSCLLGIVRVWEGREGPFQVTIFGLGLACYHNEQGWYVFSWGVWMPSWGVWIFSKPNKSFRKINAKLNGWHPKGEKLDNCWVLYHACKRWRIHAKDYATWLHHRLEFRESSRDISTCMGAMKETIEEIVIIKRNKAEDYYEKDRDDIKNDVQIQGRRDN
ncbi:hypothetical protein L1987_76432 [Smallanthus sonchifolius]|uniref:Uncharacterized protein n=1 Tax=Smallanthus sonchifolius TaxID=185202 RepID=A0ACB8Z8A0_9ASTR|nr:hypothetical protein L1987_76432 [Smallanthus sonchifolius]